MIIPPIRNITKTMLITQRYEYPRHRGIDLRTQRFKPSWGLQWIQLTEDSQVLRFGEDRYGNDFIVVRPLKSRYYEIKYIHVTLEETVCDKGRILEVGTKLGKSQLKGNSRGHHLHFEVLEEVKKWIDPAEYFIENGIKFKYKHGPEVVK